MTMNPHDAAPSDPSLAPLLGALAEGSPSGELSTESGSPGLVGLDALQQQAPRPFVRGQTLLLVAVVAIAGGVLFAMRQIGLGPGSAIAAGFKDSDLGVVANSRDHRNILADLNASRTDRQVPEENVKKNPFRLLGAANQPEVGPVPGDDSGARAAADAERIRKQAEARMGLVRQKFAQLQLNGVMGGSSPVARISGRVYRQGEVVVDLFLVREIHQRSVELECDGIVYTLEIPIADSRP